MYLLLEVWLFESSSNHFDTLQNVEYILTFTIVDEFLLLCILAGFSLKFPSRCKFLAFCPPGTKIMYYFRFEETYCKVQSLFSNLLSEIVRSDPILSKIGFNLSSTIRSNLSSKIACNVFIQSFI